MIDPSTPALHRERAAHFLDRAQDYGVDNPNRTDLLLRAIVHGLLANSNEPAPPPVVNISCPAGADLADLLKAATAPAEPTANPTPRKRATPRKTTESKGTTK